MPGFAYDYLAAGCFTEVNLARNSSDIRKVQLKPWYLRDFDGADQTTELFGETYDAPFGVAPVGLQGLMWPKGMRVSGTGCGRSQHSVHAVHGQHCQHRANWKNHGRQVLVSAIPSCRRRTARQDPGKSVGGRLPHAGDFGGHTNVRLSPKRNPKWVVDSAKDDASKHRADVFKSGVGDGATDCGQA